MPKEDSRKMYIQFRLSETKLNTIFRFKLRYFFNSLSIAWTLQNCNSLREKIVHNVNNKTVSLNLSIVSN